MSDVYDSVYDIPMDEYIASLRPYDYLGDDYYSQEGLTVLEEHKIGFIGENVAFMDPLRGEQWIRDSGSLSAMGTITGHDLSLPNLAVPGPSAQIDSLSFSLMDPPFCGTPEQGISPVLSYPSAAIALPLGMSEFSFHFPHEAAAMTCTQSISRPLAKNPIPRSSTLHITPSLPQPTRRSLRRRTHTAKMRTTPDDRQMKAHVERTTSPTQLQKHKGNLRSDSCEPRTRPYIFPSPPPFTTGSKSHLTTTSADSSRSSSVTLCEDTSTSSTSSTTFLSRKRKAPSSPSHYPGPTYQRHLDYGWVLERDTIAPDIDGTPSARLELCPDSVWIHKVDWRQTPLKWGSTALPRMSINCISSYVINELEDTEELVCCGISGCGAQQKSSGRLVRHIHGQGTGHLSLLRLCLHCGFACRVDNWKRHRPCHNKRGLQKRPHEVFEVLMRRELLEEERAGNAAHAAMLRKQLEECQ